MRILLVVDLQQEFVSGLEGKRRYQDALKYIHANQNNYGYILASCYINKDNVNMQRLVRWDECKNIAPLDFIPDRVYMHSGYAPLDFPKFELTDQIDVIGFDTDACVLAHCFRLFDMQVNFTVLSKYCWSSGGKSMHEAGLSVMKRQFRGAIK